MALSSARFPPLLLLTLGVAVGLSELAPPPMVGLARLSRSLSLSLSGGSSAQAASNVTRGGKAGGEGGNSSLSGSSGAAGPGGKRKKEGDFSAMPFHEQTMMIQRALYVLIVVTAFVIIYFVVRTVRMRRVNRKTRKYGVLNTHLENMEMRPLDQEDDEEDDTLFDVNHSRR
ncbi:membrane protein FAM174A [Callorhinchus milii]|uniref:Transmembrane protein 157 n=1 Tax=Callorhinchus milii TaxID=7868 RepID=A0A4W3JHH0_CALMI|nr:membrane protein FAM174A [Callorhinchus milii]|eukprot:gi/632951459/ref/XP_007891305.1/ PREDICTED: membrane protein FAM174A [Callorhinchus milii]